MNNQKKYYKKNIISILLMIILFVLVGCSGGGGGGGTHYPPELTLEDLVGTYTVTDFTATYDNGITLTPSDVTTFSGTMVIASSGTMSQTVEIDGFVSLAQAEILSVSNTAIRLSMPECTYNIGIELTGNILTTSYPLGTCGHNYGETDVWEKTSRTSKQINIDSEDIPAIIGGSIGAIYEYIP